MKNHISALYNARLETRQFQSLDPHVVKTQVHTSHSINARSKRKFIYKSLGPHQVEMQVIKTQIKSRLHIQFYTQPSQTIVNTTKLKTHRHQKQVTSLCFIFRRLSAVLSLEKNDYPQKIARCLLSC